MYSVKKAQYLFKHFLQRVLLRNVFAINLVLLLQKGLYSACEGQCGTFENLSSDSMTNVSPYLDREAMCLHAWKIEQSRMSHADFTCLRCCADNANFCPVLTCFQYCGWSYYCSGSNHILAALQVFHLHPASVPGAQHGHCSVQISGSPLP